MLYFPNPFSHNIKKMFLTMLKVSERITMNVISQNQSFHVIRQLIRIPCTRCNFSGLPLQLSNNNWQTVFVQYTIFSSTKMFQLTTLFPASADDITLPMMRDERFCNKSFSNNDILVKIW